jgi:hypothetical protein
MPRPRTQQAVDRAIKRTPGRIAKQARGIPTHKERKSFQVYTVSQLMQTFEDPRAVLMRIAQMDTQELARMCDCSMIDALAERRLSAQAVLPYVAQKLPIQIDTRHTKAIHLNIVSDEEFRELSAIAAAPDPMSIEIQLAAGVAEAKDE